MAEGTKSMDAYLDRAKCPHCGELHPEMVKLLEHYRRVGAHGRKGAKFGKLGGRPVDPNSRRQKKLRGEI